MSSLTKLDNGIRVVTYEMPHVETVTLGMWHEVGARCEKAENSGISHFLEHMAFKGTSRRTARQIAEAIEFVGGDMNAYTSREVTAYHARVMGRDAELAVDIIADILLNPTFPGAELERERGVILQEIGQTLDTPDDVVFEHFQSTAFKNQAMGRPVIGTADIVKSLHAEDLRKYMNTFYQPDKMVFSAAGKLKHDEIVSLVEKYFGEHKLGGKPSAPEEGHYIGGVTADFRPQLEQAHIVLGFNGVSLQSTDYYSAAICSSILGGGMSSRLFQEVREKRGLVYAVYSFNGCYSDTGTLCIYAGTAPDKVDEVISISMEQLSDMRNRIDESELNRALAQFKMGLLMSLESTSAMCERNASQVMIFGRTIDNSELISKINAVSIDSVRNVAKKIYQSPKTLAFVGNVESKTAQDILEKCNDCA
ncbi:MAG: insulinase family protein [Holosporales bacterium]|jgi:predicted Zn-dependent peptidase|nr:insulinase family protein [Holosporales bacterium]